MISKDAQTLFKEETSNPSTYNFTHIVDRMQLRPIVLFYQVTTCT